MRYGIFGGSFDPIHIGHVRLADAAVNDVGLEKLFLVPNHISPFKLDQKVTPAEDRIEMVRSILYVNDAFEISDYEVAKDGPSYTIDTLNYFKSEYGDELYFVLGYDSMMTIDTWFHGPEILKNFKLITGRRPGTDDCDCKAKIEEYRSTYNAKITVLELEPFDAASSDIRQLIAENKPLDRYILPEVEEYIRLHGLYR